MKAIKILTFDIKDYLVDIVIEYEDLANAWMVLKQEYESEVLIIELNLNYVLSTMKF